MLHVGLGMSRAANLNIIPFIFTLLSNVFRSILIQHQAWFLLDLQVSILASGGRVELFDTEPGLNSFFLLKILNLLKKQYFLNYIRFNNIYIYKQLMYTDNKGRNYLYLKNVKFPTFNINMFHPIGRTTQIRFI